MSTPTLPGTLAARRFAAAYRNFREPRVLRCPQSGGVVDIELDAMQAALSLVTGGSILRVARCAMWPECSGCEQSCLEGMDPSYVAQHGLLLRNRPAAIPSLCDEG